MCHNRWRRLSLLRKWSRRTSNCYWSVCRSGTTGDRCRTSCGSVVFSCWWSWFRWLPTGPPTLASQYQQRSGLRLFLENLETGMSRGIQRRLGKSSKCRGKVVGFVLSGKSYTFPAIIYAITLPTLERITVYKHHSWEEVSFVSYVLNPKNCPQ